MNELDLQQAGLSGIQQRVASWNVKSEGKPDQTESAKKAKQLGYKPKVPAVLRKHNAIMLCVGFLVKMSKEVSLSRLPLE